MISPESMRAADASGRLLLSKYNGRIVIMLPRLPIEEQADWITRVMQALDAAGLEALIDPEVGPSAEKIEAARQAFFEAARACGSDPIAEENAMLSIGRELLPSFALAVLDKTGEPTEEYWDWLREGTEQAQAEHDREVAAGHEWHD